MFVFLKKIEIRWVFNINIYEINIDLNKIIVSRKFLILEGLDFIC